MFFRQLNYQISSTAAPLYGASEQCSQFALIRLQVSYVWNNPNKNIEALIH